MPYIRPMGKLRPGAGVLFRVVLCLSLVLATVTSAVAHVQMATGQVVTICSGTQTLAVTLDAKGNPVTEMGMCPDCSPGLFAAILPGLPKGPGHDALGRAQVFARHVQRSLACRLPPETARGPPHLI